MAAAPRDASKEHAPIEKKNDPSGRHPRSRTGATAKKRARENAARERLGSEKSTPAPAQKKGKK